MPKFDPFPPVARPKTPTLSDELPYTPYPDGLLVWP
jgi:hypothetical protein